MEVQRKCQWCGKPFIAHTMVTRFCSKSCTEKAYKDRKRKQKLQEYEARQSEQPMQEVGIVGSKPFLSPAEAATLLGISRATIYRHMAAGIIRALQLRGRTIIRKSDIEKMFDNAPDYKKRNYGRKQTVLYYTTNEILEKYQIQKKTLYRRCKLYSIPKVEEGSRVFYNRTLIDKYFADLAEEINPDCYYTPEQVMEKYGMSRNAVVTFALRHNIPRINRQPQGVLFPCPYKRYQRKAGQAESRLLYLFGNHREIWAYQDKHQLLCQQIRYNEVQTRKPDYGIAHRV